MKPHTKDVIQYGSAMAMMATGILLSVCSFFWLRFIHASVLTYMGEAVCRILLCSIWPHSLLQVKNP